MSGQTVHVGSSTTVFAKKGVSVGSIVKVEETQRPDRSIDATRIQVKKTASSSASFQFTGVVGNLPSTAGMAGDWAAGGRIVHVTVSTQIKQRSRAIIVGSVVDVEGALQSDGSVNATKVKLEM